MTLHPQFSDVIITVPTTIDPIAGDRKGRTFGPCSKCRSSGIRLDFHRAKSIDCKYNQVCESLKWSSEHLAANCVRCHHGWLEPTSSQVSIKPGAAWDQTGG